MDGCFSLEAVFVVGLVFSKGVCTFISGMRFYFIREDVGFRVTDSIRKYFEDVSLDIVKNNKIMKLS